MLERLSQELIENHGDFSKSILIGLQPRGVLMARRIHRILQNRLRIPAAQIPLGLLDVTFHRDDFRRQLGVLKIILYFAKDKQTPKNGKQSIEQEHQART
ncbi:MAG: hypothetical protein ACKOKH_02880, partial [Bacteroidota bacterium]